MIRAVTLRCQGMLSRDARGSNSFRRLISQPQGISGWHCRAHCASSITNSKCNVWYPPLGLFFAHAEPLTDVQFMCLHAPARSGPACLVSAPDRRDPGGNRCRATATKKCVRFLDELILIFIPVSRSGSLQIDQRPTRSSSRHLLLQETADTWRMRMKPADLPRRFAGEEFLAMLPGIAAEESIRVAPRMLFAVSAGQALSTLLPISMA
jgi:hypothetical protein